MPSILTICKLDKHLGNENMVLLVISRDTRFCEFCVYFSSYDSKRKQDILISAWIINLKLSILFSTHFHRNWSFVFTIKLLTNFTRQFF